MFRFVSLPVFVFALVAPCFCLAQGIDRGKEIVLLDANTPLYLPVPSDLVSLKGEAPKAFAKKVAEAEGKQLVLATFVENDYASAARTGKLPAVGHEIDVTAPVGKGSGVVSDDDFDKYIARLRDKTTKQNVEHGKPVELNKDGHTAAFAEEGAPEPLVDQANAYAFVATRSLTGDGTFMLVKIVYALMHVRGRVVFVVGMSTIKTPNDVTWLKSTMTSWIAKTLDSNQLAVPQGNPVN